MLEKFPKIRPELPSEYQEIYARHYKENRDGASQAAGLAQRMESWMHKKIAADVSAAPAKSTLEIGAGTLNQLQYEKHSEPYDIVEPFASLYENSPFLERVRNIYADVREIPSDHKYNRITSCAVFEHICELPDVVARSGTLLAENGTLRVAIPSEGTPLWRLGYTYTTGLEFKRKYGLDYEVLMRHEHVNTAKEIEEVLRYYFKGVSGKVFGVSKALSFYQFFECSEPDGRKCAA